MFLHTLIFFDRAARQVRELEVGLSAPSLRHSIGYSCAWRDVIPVPHPTDPFATANSPE